jgi:hypothetical protein
MNLSWIFNGTMEAHHLVAVYVLVWVVQGGYAGWIAWQMVRSRKSSQASAPLTSATRDRS